MRTIIQNVCAVAILVLLTTSAFADTTYSDRKVVKFSDPGKSGTLIIVSGKGDITVDGYSGKEVIIETKSTVENVLNQPDNEKAKGMKRISGSGLNIAAREDENAIVITRSMKNESDLVLKVPYNTSVQCGGDKTGNAAQSSGIEPGSNINVGMIVNSVLASLNIPGGLLGGNITVSNISGGIEVSMLDGNITLKNISGGVVANSLDGDLLITFKAIDKNKPMAFSTIDGDIDVTFPSDIRATVTAKNVEGNTYTDFEMEMTTWPDVVNEENNTGFTNNLVGMFGNSVTGKINGGGAEIQMTTIDGDIYIRKGE